MYRLKTVSIKTLGGAGGGGLKPILLDPKFVQLFDQWLSLILIRKGIVYKIMLSFESYVFNYDILWIYWIRYV